MENNPETNRIPARPLIILTGPPGAGKSTVAREMIAQSPEPIASIEGDTFWHFFPYASAADRRKGDFRTMLRAMLHTAAAYATGGYETILDFSVPPWYIEGIRKIAVARGIPTHYVMLLPSEEICTERFTERSSGVTADYERFHDFYATFKEAEGPVLTEILPAVEMAARIWEGVEKGIFRLGDTLK